VQDSLENVHKRRQRSRRLHFSPASVVVIMYRLFENFRMPNGPGMNFRLAVTLYFSSMLNPVRLKFFRLQSPLYLSI
jgi:hypothetical protein